MEIINKDLTTLFDQLGLDSDQESIDAFVASHTLPQGVKLSEADFWNPAQAALLREELAEDADWEPVVDELNVLLHQKNDV
ncbi:DUF2789 domain-containing protein [Stutzerimonas tarimensis]|uniref:DUF2789 domain-containing protein n=1 Tax=Stutzerimonas tarimensis TaxID=1507735 RepID=A0ABV7SZV8_9GAMM